MITRWRRSPEWVIGLVTGAAFAVWMAGFSLLQHHSWPAAVISGAFSGALFGLIMGPFTVRQRRQFRAAVETDDETYAAAVRSLRRGRSAESAQVRRAATAVLQERLLATQRSLRWAVPVFLVFTAVTLAAALLAPSPWTWASVAAFPAILVFSWWQQRRLRRRVAELSDDPVG